MDCAVHKVNNYDIKLLTFRQFSFACSGWFGLLAPDGGPPAADPADDRHGVIISSGLQGVPVCNEGHPAVLPLKSHLKRHESLQVHVTVGVRGTVPVKAFSWFLVRDRAHIAFCAANSHCPLILSHQLARELAQDIQKC